MTIKQKIISKKQLIKVSSLALIAGVTLIISPKVAFATPATFTVTNTNDSGAGSLRQAILDANSNGNANDMDIIAFNIPGSNVHTIAIQTDLPIVTQKVTINGYTQPGAKENTAPNLLTVKLK